MGDDVANLAIDVATLGGYWGATGAGSGGIRELYRGAFGGIPRVSLNLVLKFIGLY